MERVRLPYHVKRPMEQQEEARKRGDENTFVFMKCSDAVDSTLCVRVQNLISLCSQSEGFKWLLLGHPSMQQEDQLNLSLFEIYGVKKREACILMHWAEHGSFFGSDHQLIDSVECGELRETCTSLGGGFSELLAAAHEVATNNKPTSPPEDLRDQYEWKIVDLSSHELNNEILDKIHGDGWVFVKKDSSSTYQVTRLIFNRKRITATESDYS